MKDQLDKEYFAYLKSLVEDDDVNKTYDRLLDHLFRVKYIHIVKGDENRASDGVDIRRRFMFQSRLPRYLFTDEWFNIECSMLEMLVALAQKFAFQVDQSVREAFWHMIRNTALIHNDDIDYEEDVVDDALERILFRQYRANGEGGFFPLTQINRDQRNVELLYQLYTYVNQEYYP